MDDFAIKVTDFIFFPWLIYFYFQFYPAVRMKKAVEFEFKVIYNRFRNQTIKANKKRGKKNKISKV